MGFLAESYSPGVHEAGQPFLQSLYDNKNGSKDMNFILYKDTDECVSVSEPHSKSIHDLISEKLTRPCSNTTWASFGTELFYLR